MVSVPLGAGVHFASFPLLTDGHTYKEGTRDGVKNIKRPSSSQVHSPSSGMELRAHLSPSWGTQQHEAI